MNLILDIYKTLRHNDFTSKGQDVENNKRLGITRTFTDKSGRYIEIYPEIWGYTIFVYGTGFMNGYYPRCFSVSDKNDIKEMGLKIRNVIRSSEA